MPTFNATDYRRRYADIVYYLLLQDGEGFLLLQDGALKLVLQSGDLSQTNYSGVIPSPTNYAEVNSP